MSDINPNEVNPFLADIPVVTIVTQVKIVNGTEVETPVSDCTRVWGRLGGSTKRDANHRDLFEELPERVFPTEANQQRVF